MLQSPVMTVKFVLSLLVFLLLLVLYILKLLY